MRAWGIIIITRGGNAMLVAVSVVASISTADQAYNVHREGQASTRALHAPSSAPVLLLFGTPPVAAVQLPSFRAPPAVGGGATMRD